MSKDKSGNWFVRHKVITGIAVVFLIIAALGAGSPSDTDTATNNSDSAGNSESAEAPSAELAKIGGTVRDGKFEFVVNGVDCGKTTVGGEFFNETAQGQFCIMDVSVKNIGDEAQLFNGSDQFVFNAEGQKYSNDSSAEIALAGDSSTFLEEINPGNTVEGRVVFDVPTDQTLVKAELHDSSFSGGVEVSLQ